MMISATTTEPEVAVLQRLLDGSEPRTSEMLRDVDDHIVCRSLDELATDAEATALVSVLVVQRVLRGRGFEAFRGQLAELAILNPAENTLEARSRLVAEVIKHALLLSRLLATAWTATSSSQWIDPSRGIHVWDAIFFDYLQQLGPHGAEIATALLTHSQRRAQWLRERDDRLAYKGYPPSNAPIWKLWWHPGRPFDCGWVAALGRALWLDVLRPELARGSVELRSLDLGDGYAKLPKHTAGMSWLFGGTTITVDGSDYVQEPGFAKRLLVPSHAPLLADGERTRPEQISLPFVFPDQEDEPLAVAVTNATKWAIGAVASKVALLALADTHAWEGRFISASALEFVKLVSSDVQRLQVRDLERVGVAFHELGKLVLVLPDYTKVRPFDTRSPVSTSSITRDMKLGIALGPGFLSAVEPLYRGRDRGPYNGSFLLNLSGVLKLPNKAPALIRHIVRASAAWNAATGDRDRGGYDPAKQPYFTLDEWAQLTNSYPPRVWEYLASHSDQRKSAQSRRVDRHRERKAVREDLERLVDEYNLAKLESKGRTTVRYRLAPPAEWLEAWQRKRNGER
jgi:hypothetical protein